MINLKYKVIYSKRKTLAITIKDGEVIARAPYGFNEKRIEAFINNNQKWIEEHIKQSVDRMSRLQVTPEIERKLRIEAKEYLTEKTEYYARIMGIKYGRITITGAKTRFGSCNNKGDIAYSYRLMLFPEKAREYVVVHELSHILHFNHSIDFYREIERIFPDYKERKRLLK
jgi:predicted metal-dependent hydrolase